MTQTEIHQIDEASWAERCRTDGEFAMAARHWTGGLKINVGTECFSLSLEEGAVQAPTSPTPTTGVV